VAKDTEKLIRQLSLISFLMAQGRPVSALEIKREVEGYSDMNDDAFARRFYADRAELESLGIELGVEKPGEGFFEAELYSLPPENFYLDAIEFSDDELAAMSTALMLLSEGEFAYAEPLRLALQQVAWGHPNPLKEGERAPVEMAMTASAGGRELSQRLSKIETAISRRKTVEFTYYTMERDETTERKVDPYHLVFRGGQFYLIGYAHEREAVRVFRLSRIQGKVGYASKAEHDFSPPEDFDRRDYGQRADWQLGEIRGRAQVFVRDRIAWLIERDFGAYGELRPAKKADGAPGKGLVYETDYASPRELIAWVLRWRQNAEVLGPEELREEAQSRLGLLHDRHRNGFESAETVDRPLREAPRRPRSNGRGEAAIRPERFARLVTLAGLLIESAKGEERLRVSELRQRLELTDEELQEDIDLLNVVNFGGGTYVLYAEVQGDEIEVDSEPYGDNFARPARLLPLEAKALVAAIDLFGDHLPQGGLQSARA
jgi:predicted DNA-binding transcriptional regulator YafY